MITCTRKIEFDAAHRVMEHESKCATLHGHRYVVEIEAKGELDEIGRVIDFSVLKEKIGGWIDKNMDHNSLVYCYDEETLRALRSIPRKKEPYVTPFNPTAENLAQYFLTSICPMLLLGTGVVVVSVKVYETPNCFAVATL